MGIGNFVVAHGDLFHENSLPLMGIGNHPNTGLVSCHLQLITPHGDREPGTDLP